MTTPYQPHPDALAFHQSPDKYRRLIGPARVGKTHACAVEFVAMMTGVPIPEAPQTQKLCKHGVILTTDGCQVGRIYGRLFGDPSTLTTAFVEKFVWEDKAIGWAREVVLTNGGVIQFVTAMAILSGETRGRQEPDVIWADEILGGYPQDCLRHMQPRHSFMWSQYDPGLFTDFHMNPPVEP